MLYKLVNVTYKVIYVGLKNWIPKKIIISWWLICIVFNINGIRGLPKNIWYLWSRASFFEKFLPVYSSNAVMTHRKTTISLYHSPVIIILYNRHFTIIFYRLIFSIAIPLHIWLVRVGYSADGDLYDGKYILQYDNRMVYLLPRSKF